MPIESFDQNEQKSLVAYVDNAKAVNRFMRGKDLPKGERKVKLKAQVDAINSALKKSSLAADMTLWRGVYGSTLKIERGRQGIDRQNSSAWRLSVNIDEQGRSKDLRW